MGLPFLYGWKWYTWARDFYESTNKINLLCAANQISKSSTQIRKCINWATNQDLWPELWINRPTQFWYLYPSQDQVDVEFKTKWVQFLPTGDYKKSGPYAWAEIKDSGKMVGIHFLTSNVYVFFKTYTQKAAVLQSSTLDAIFTDEELPANLYEELMFRISASNGYFNMVFTATLGQEFWRLAMEPGLNEVENLPGAWKRTVSMYDCMKYEDGTPSHWTMEKIKLVEARCGTQAEVLKRVHGRFIVIGGRKYEAFDIKSHMKPKHPLPKDWLVYSGVDPGSGGQAGHPASICFVAVRPDFRAGRVFAGWRGDGIHTTAGDVVEKYIAMKKDLNLQSRITAQYYDWSNRDFFEIASRMGENFQKAEKGHDIGEDVINTLFKNDMLFIYETDELVKLGGELATLLKNTPKNKAKDDFADSFRYAVSKVPWDWSAITGDVREDTSKADVQLNAYQQEVADRRRMFDDDNSDEQARLDADFNEINEAYGE